MSRKRRNTADRDRLHGRAVGGETVSLPNTTTDSRTSQVVVAWLAALLAARWLMPSEGVAFGGSLWLVTLVLLTGAVQAAIGWRLGESRFRFDVCDAAMWWLIAAQTISALAVVLDVGDGRAAVNVAWEWVGSGILIWLLRQKIDAVRSRELCVGLSLLAAVWGGFGIWQQQVEFPRLGREYDQMRRDLEELTQPQRVGELSPVEWKKLRTLQLNMVRQGLPLDGESLRYLEQRLKASKEPLGLFALANTFAAVLVAALLMQIGLLLSMWRNARWRIALLAMLVPTAYCLLLTKSRTAWVGLIAGAGWWVVHRAYDKWQTHRSRTATATEGFSDGHTESKSSHLIRWWLAGGLVVVCGIGVAIFSGGLDRFVLSEAQKSLRYRWEYWQGTWATILEHFWLGTGPGNFRDHYLHHKLPASSEEIADPHNLWLDVWANAGVFGFVGLLACVACMIRTWVMRTPDPNNDPNTAIARPSTQSASVVGVGLSFVIVLAGLDLFGFGTDLRLWWLAGIWWLVWLGLIGWQRIAERQSASPPVDGGALAIGLESANVALLVHLLGAGGIAMPAVTQLLWLTWALRAAESSSESTKMAAALPSSQASAGVIASARVDRAQSRFWFLRSVEVSEIMVTGGMMGLLGLCLATATLPELACRTDLSLGDAAGIERGDHRAAVAHYQRAASSDRLAIEPWDRLAETAMRQSQATKSRSDFEAADQQLAELTSRLPYAARVWHRRGRAWLARAEALGSKDDARRAAEFLQVAVDHYPHHAELLADLATAHERAGQIEFAIDAARRAIAQDEINHQLRHSDKYLPSPTRQRLEKIVQGKGN